MFSICRHFLRSMEQFLKTEDELFHILTQIRATYTSKIKEPGFSMSNVSLLGTLADTITEVHVGKPGDTCRGWGGGNLPSQ